MGVQDVNHGQIGDVQGKSTVGKYAEGAKVCLHVLTCVLVVLYAHTDGYDEHARARTRSHLYLLTHGRTHKCAQEAHVQTAHKRCAQELYTHIIRMNLHLVRGTQAYPYFHLRIETQNQHASTLALAFAHRNTVQARSLALVGGYGTHMSANTSITDFARTHLSSWLRLSSAATPCTARFSSCHSKRSQTSRPRNCKLPRSRAP